MFRTLFTVGCIAGFIACAFVPPTDANFQTVEEMAKHQVRERTVSSLVGTGMNSTEAKKVADVLKTVANHPEISANLKNVTGTAADQEILKRAADTLSAFASPKKAIKRVTSVAVHAVQTHKFSAAWKKAKSSSSKDHVTQMERIEWASRKQDVRLCQEVTGNADVTTGDYVALCVAVVTGDPERCSSVRSIRQMCTDELASS